MGDISIQHDFPEISSGQIGLRLDIFRDSPTLCQEDGDHDLGDSNRQPRTQFGVPGPPDQLVIHSPSLHQCLSTNGMTPDDLHLGDLQSPTVPPANSFDRPQWSSPWAGESPGLASNSTHSTVTPPSLALPRSCRGVEPIKSNLFPFPLPLYKKARHIERISQRQAKSRKFFRISIFGLKRAKNVPKRTKSCHVDFVQTDTGRVRKKGPVSTRVLS